jgi:hypothetical protein
MNPLVTLLIEQGVNLLKDLAMDATDGIREQLLQIVHKKYVDAQDTPGVTDDLAWGALQDALHMLEGGYAIVIDNEFKEALIILYYRAKNTPNPVDDILMGLVFKIFDIETPVSTE